MKIDIENVGDYGHDLNRPECVLCLGSGDLFVSHKGVGVTHIAPGGRQRIIGGARDVDGHELVPNGIALLPDRSFLIANIGEAGGVWRLQADGTITPYLIEVDGERLVAANFVMNDAQGRVWITVSTRKQPRFLAYSPEVADGFVVLADARGAVSTSAKPLGDASAVSPCVPTAASARAKISLHSDTEHFRTASRSTKKITCGLRVSSATG